MKKLTHMFPCFMARRVTGSRDRAAFGDKAHKAIIFHDTEPGIQLVLNKFLLPDLGG